MSDRPLTERLLGPDGPELGCDECFEYLDHYVEAEAAGVPALDGCPRCVSPEACTQAAACLGMRAHLQGCPACADEYASLKALLAEP